MTRTFALIALSVLTLLACGDDRRSNSEPAPACEVGQGHLCGESAPGVECPPNMVCMADGIGVQSCQARCNINNPSTCRPNYCDSGSYCEVSYGCFYNTLSDGTSSELCSSGANLYTCPNPDGACPDGFEEREGWCVNPSDGWAGTPFN